ncbi:plasmid transfer protein TraA [Streptomyces luteireticuli]|uniref:Sporulation protein SsgA n=1 Tax=Streptomyces luteireticuli TaxID=173858 RepID=A0ABP3IUI1_9ACTN
MPTTPKGPGNGQGTNGAWGAYQPPPNNQRSRTSNRTSNRQYHFHMGGGPGANGNNGGGRGNGTSGFFRKGDRQQGSMHSPLADPEFFSNVDVRNYCDAGRGLFLQLSFELAAASEVLQAVLKEIPDPEGHPFGSRMRARRVAKRLMKAAEDARDTAKNMAATYSAFQREFEPELAPYRSRQRPTGRRFDFNG